MGFGEAGPNPVRFWQRACQTTENGSIRVVRPWAKTRGGGPGLALPRLFFWRGFCFFFFFFLPLFFLCSGALPSKGAKKKWGARFSRDFRGAVSSAFRDGTTEPKR